MVDIPYSITYKDLYMELNPAIDRLTSTGNPLFPVARIGIAILLHFSLLAKVRELR